VVFTVDCGPVKSFHRDEGENRQLGLAEAKKESSCEMREIPQRGAIPLAQALNKGGKAAVTAAGVIIILEVAFIAAAAIRICMQQQRTHTHTVWKLKT
jgi:hypothetical protein